MKKWVVPFFRILKLQEGEDISSFLQSYTHLLSFHQTHMRRRLSHADPDFCLPKDQETTQTQREGTTERRSRLSFYIYSPAMHRYI